MKVLGGAKRGLLRKKSPLHIHSRKIARNSSIFSSLGTEKACTSRESYAPSAHEKKIAPALALIQNEFLLRELSVPELATVCSMGESYFTRLFKEKYGVPPKKYIIGLKINHACDLLRLDRYTVSQVADLCAFSDVSYFSRLFREVMGISPTEFVKKYKSSK